MNIHNFAEKRGIKVNFELLGVEYTRNYEDVAIRWCAINNAAILVEIDKILYIFFTTKKALFTARKTIWRFFERNPPTIKIEDLARETILKKAAIL